MSPGHTLKVYLAEEKMSVKDFAQLIGCHPVYLSRVINERASAGYHLSKLIESVTNGRVKLEVGKKSKKYLV